MPRVDRPSARRTRRELRRSGSRPSVNATRVSVRRPGTRGIAVPTPGSARGPPTCSARPPRLCVHREEPGPRHAVLQAGPCRSSQRGAARRESFVEMAHATSERQDLGTCDLQGTAALSSRRSGDAAHVEGEHGKASGDDDVGERDRFVRSVGDVGVAGPYCRVGMPPRPVSSRRSLPYGAIHMSCACRRMRRRGPADTFQQVAVRRQPAGCELAAPPLDLGRMFAQPRIGCADLGDRRSNSARASATGSPSATPRRPSATSRSGTDEAQSPPCSVPIESGCGRPNCDQRVDVAVAAGLELRSACHTGQNFSIALTPSVRRDGVRRGPWTRNRNVSAPALPGTRSSRSARGSHMRRPASPGEQRERAETAVLLALHGGQQ